VLECLPSELAASASSLLTVTVPELERVTVLGALVAARANLVCDGAQRFVDYREGVFEIVLHFRILHCFMLHHT